MPWTRAIVGCGSRVSFIITRLQASKRSRCHAGSSCVRNSLRSWPAQKPLPSPAMTSARTLASSPAPSIAASSAASISRDSALKRSPRFIVSVRTPSCVRVSTYGRTPASTGAFIGIPFRPACSLDGLRRARTLAQQKFLDLAGGRLRQFAEHDALRNLVAREMLAAVLEQLVGLDASAGLQLDERARRLAPARIGLRDDGRAEDRRMAI